MSLKLSAIDDAGNSTKVESFEKLPDGIAAAVHRVVHGGELHDPVLIDAAVEDRLRQLIELAPLHNAPAVEALVTARRALPGIPHVAVFDTAFHATLPRRAATYALPERWRSTIRRYGFHGLSVQWASEQIDVPRLVVCHLGGGCSVTAVRSGQSVDTTMGFTPLEGVPMATRAGSVDPGALLYLSRHGVSSEELDRSLEHESGLLGLSGVSGDVAQLQRSDAPSASFALEVFAYRVATAVGAMSAALGGLDALVFTAGIGEHSARVRRDVCTYLTFLGVELDEDRNATAIPDADVASTASMVRVVVLRAREDLVAARAARALLASDRGA